MKLPDCPFEIQINYGKCESPDIDITNLEQYACIVKICQRIRELNAGAPPNVNIYMAQEMKDAIFPLWEAIVIDGHRIPVVVVDWSPIIKQEDTLHGDIWIGNFEEGELDE